LWGGERPADLDLPGLTTSGEKLQKMLLSEKGTRLEAEGEEEEEEEEVLSERREESEASARAEVVEVKSEEKGSSVTWPRFPVLAR
jgi:hypothetical protein